MGLPDFTQIQLQTLTSLGVKPEQVAQLRFALIDVALVFNPVAARNDVRDVLTGVVDQTDKLLRSLNLIAKRVDAMRSTACTAIEVGYWEMHPEDDGPTAMHHLLPRLMTLKDAARKGIESLPQGQTRRRTASWKPIRSIENAMLLGWSRAFGPNVIHGEQAEAAVSRAPMYPQKFRPSESATSTFSQVVAVCYEAAGAPRDTDPKRAIRAYLKIRAARREAMRAEIDKGLRRLRKSRARKP